MISDAYNFIICRWCHNHYLRKSILRQAQDDKTMEEKSLNFLEEIIDEYMNSGKDKEIVTHFPPKPNGYFTPLSLLFLQP